MKVDISDGKILDNIVNLSYPNIDKIITIDGQIPGTDASDEISILISERDKKYYLTDVESTEDILKYQKHHSLYSYRISNDKRSIHGYKLQDNVLIDTWDINLPDQEVIVEVGSVPRKSN